MHNQIYAFSIFILNGFLIGLLFDIFRISRKSFKTPDSVTYLEDIIFWLLSGGMLLYSIFKFNNGELRFFIFVGIFVGISMYMLVFSKLLIKVSVRIIDIIKGLITVLILKPFKFIIKTIFRPILYLISKLMKIINKTKSFFKSKTKRLIFYNKKSKSKKDFI